METHKNMGVPLEPQNETTNSSWKMVDVPSVFVNHVQLGKVAALVERKVSQTGVTFSEMAVYTIFGQGTGVYLSGVKVKKNETVPVLLAYELTDDNRSALQNGEPLTVDYLNNSEVKLPVPWPPSGQHKKKK